MGGEGSLLERPNLFAEREYRVTLVEPPSFTRTPSTQKFPKKEGDPLTLSYEAEGSGEIEYTWYFDGAGVDRSTRQPAVGDNWKIVSDGRRTSLQFDGLTEESEGEYFLVAENMAGREKAPPVSVAVFQPPRLEAFVVRDGDEPEYRIVVEDTEEPTQRRKLSVNAGQSLEIEAEVAGSGTIEVVWKREDPEKRPTAPRSRRFEPPTAFRPSDAG